MSNLLEKKVENMPVSYLSHPYPVEEFTAGKFLDRSIDTDLVEQLNESHRACRTARLLRKQSHKCFSLFGRDTSGYYKVISLSIYSKDTVTAIGACLIYKRPGRILIK